MPYILSTLTAPQRYTSSKPTADGRGIPKIIRSVFIAGGHGVADKNFITPQGVVTKVSEDELAFLETVPSFGRHKSRGFITIMKSEPSRPENKIVDMASGDKSAPITPKKLQSEGKSEPTVGGEVEEPKRRGRPPKS